MFLRVDIPKPAPMDVSELKFVLDVVSPHRGMIVDHSGDASREEILGHLAEQHGTQIVTFDSSGLPLDRDPEAELARRFGVVLHRAGKTKESVSVVFDSSTFPVQYLPALQKLVVKRKVGEQALPENVRTILWNAEKRVRVADDIGYDSGASMGGFKNKLQWHSVQPSDSEMQTIQAKRTQGALRND